MPSAQAWGIIIWDNSNGGNYKEPVGRMRRKAQLLTGQQGSGEAMGGGMKDPGGEEEGQ